MADSARKASRTVTILWFLATALALTAVAIRYFRSGEVGWSLIAAAAFTFTLGLTSLRRTRAAGPTAGRPGEPSQR
jgi:hypothetical protein